MKKIICTGFLFVLVSLAASAQQGPGDRILRHRVANGIRSGEITRFECLQLRKDITRYRAAQRQVRRDGVVTPYERRKIHMLKIKARRDAFRFSHNRRQRVI